MVVSIGSNVISGMLRRQLDGATSIVSRVTERLGSGQRINRASDDPAGLAISSTLGASSRVYTQGIRNINDAISAISIAEGSVDQQQSIVLRLRELATSASSGQYGRTQRLSLNDEAKALVSEFNRIGASTKFNGRSLIDGTLDGLSIQFGFGSSEALQTQVGDALKRKVGTGSFTSASSGLPEISSARSGDINGDGIDDIVYQTGMVRIGQGNGIFAIGTNWGGAVNEVELGDVNGDGKLDIVSRATNRFGILLGDGTGRFTETSTFSQTNTLNFELGDVNNDGRDDVVVLSSSLLSTYVVDGAGIASFASSSTQNTGAVAFASMHLQDANGDGNLDLFFDALLVNSQLAFGSGSGGFAAGIFTTTTSGSFFNPSFRAYGDFNNDGFADYVEESGVRLGLGDGRFGPVVQSFSTYGSGNPFLGDFNGDGHLDILAYDDGDIGSYIYYGNGQGGFTESSSKANTVLGTALLGDFNGDGALDYVDTDGFASTNLYTQQTSNATTLQQLNLVSREGALAALGVLDSAFTRLLTERGALGAATSRLSSALRTTEQTVTNYLAARSRLLDADISQESAAIAAAAIRQQAATGLLAQANQAPRIALDLLKAA